MNTFSTVILLFIHLTITLSSSNNTNFPIIAILSFPIPSNKTEQITKSTIWGGYIRWLEQSGSLIIPIHPWYNTTEIDSILNITNGIVFIGGKRTVHINYQYEQTMLYIFNKVVSFNQNGNYYPLFAICFGYQTLPVFIALNDTLIQDTNCVKKYIKVNLTSYANRSKLLSNFSQKEIDILSHTNSTYQLHVKGILKERYQMFPNVSDFYEVISYGTDDNGNVFINAIESKDYPIYGIQYHPEVIPFSRREGFNENTKNALIISQLHSLFFISEAYKNKNKIEYEELKKFKFISTYETKDYYTVENNYYNFNK
jgi:gamma-glutamyl-gamma-aminobutyrate hydrolase PuuD